MTTYNYLWGKTDYSELPPDERLTQEIKDFINWIEPTPYETQIRYFTIMKYSNFIEYLFNKSDIDFFAKKGSKGRKYQATVAGQGSSFTNCYIPNSDIDLIVLGLPDDINVSDCLFKIVNQLWHTKLISNAIVLKHAKVPIAKIVDKQFGIHIDISIGQINGSLNLPRVLNYFQFYPLLRSILLIMKVFTFINDLHDPAKGGFGSNHMMLIIIFVIQQNPTIQTEGELLIAVFEFIAFKMNIFLTGISTNNGGYFFSKFDIDFEKRWPHSIICQDPQYPDNYYGIRSKQSLQLVDKCRKALQNIQSGLQKVEHAPPVAPNFFAKKKLEAKDSISSDTYSDNENEDRTIEKLEKTEDEENDDYSTDDDIVEICGPSILGKIFDGIEILLRRRREFKELAALWRLPPKEYNAKLAAREQTLMRSKSTPNLRKEKLNKKNEERKARIYDIIKSKNFNKNVNRNSNHMQQIERSSQNNRSFQNRNQFHSNQKNKHRNGDFQERRNYDQDNSNRHHNDRNRVANKFDKDKRKPYKR